MAATHRSRETPYQDFTRIKNAAFIKRASRGHLHPDDLFSDPSFPPDWSSLTYVYSGDDKYERTVFKRPTEICEQPAFIGVGGVLDEPFPWKQWRQRGWFQAAVVIISMNIKFLDRLIPGYKVFEQNFDSDYIGAFRFHLWRFTEWVEVVIDDHLPVLDGSHFFCKAMGNPPEFWGPLVEKAYAKCKKTFQAIEYGNMLDALTDLTGCVCEYYTPDVNPTDNLFHIMYKSYFNRSMMVCWRNDKRPTPAAFDLEDSQKIYDDCDDQTAEDVRYLHVVTATTKFPTIDGRMVEMVRLRCPFMKEPKWNGKYSDKDTNSWNGVNSEFKDRYRPLSRKEEDEYWLTMDDFRCNFGGLVVISNTEPYNCDSISVERRYFLDNELPLSKASFGRNRPFGSGVRWSLNSELPVTSSEQCSDHDGQKTSCKAEKHMKKIPIMKQCNPSNGMNVSVRETQRTTVMDSTRSLHADSKKNARDNHIKSVSKTHVQLKERKASLPSYLNDKSSLVKEYSRRQSNPSACQPVTINQKETEKKRHKKVGSCVYSDAYSSSDISLHLRANSACDDSGRPLSAPIPRNLSTGSLSSLTQMNFLATKADFFRTHGRWRIVLEYKDRWTKIRKGVPRTNIEAHSKSPRILFNVTRADTSDDVISPEMQSKRHVIVSTLQDYRHGPSTANSLLVPIGFCIYKTKNPDRDERRHISKLHLVGEAEGRPEMREINARFDLEAGSYFVVPYFVAQSHEGEYLVRILIEGQPTGGKAACAIS